ncbi:MAG TPA: phosphotransferase family protein [Streptosporangiaceae bacterium]|jgi:aminoglycoside phosphotransferase (APT) family kinase protein|nr:phosphotransferase family protein [Streptosporangiaceae bacterium]
MTEPVLASGAQEEPPPAVRGERIQMTVSTRDPAALAEALRGWLGRKLALNEPPVISGVRMPPSGGLSSTSLLFEAEWPSAGARQRGAYVARMAPEQSAIPVFPRYDLPGQFRLIDEVSKRCGVPLPALRWNQPDGDPLGTAFFVMDQVEGRVPLDNPPYVFGGWLLDATPDERAQLERASVKIVGDLHAIPDPAAAFEWLQPPAGTSALRWHVDQQHAYYRWALADDGIRIPIIERSLDWLEQNWPADTGPDVLSWGDSRIGNIIYDGFTPVAVLDWEMAGLGPREIDVAWFIFLHRFFQDIAEFFEIPGLPDFLRRSQVERLYSEFSGHELRDMDFYLLYAALRHAIVMARIKRRMIHFGEDEVPDDIDDYVMHRASLDKLLAGTYRWD